MPSTISDIGTAAWLMRPSVSAAKPGSGRPVKPNAVPSRMPATTGLVTTPTAVLPSPRADRSRLRAHSTETVTSVHSSSELNTITSDTAGSAASPSVTFASGMPSSTVFEKIVPTPKIDCDAPSIPNAFAATTRATTNVATQPPKYASSRRASTGGRREKSLIRRNSSAGIATANTKRVSASDPAFGQRPQRDSA